MVPKTRSCLMVQSQSIFVFVAPNRTYAAAVVHGLHITRLSVMRILDVYIFITWVTKVPSRVGAHMENLTVVWSIATDLTRYVSWRRNPKNSQVPLSFATSHEKAMSPVKEHMTNGNLVIPEPFLAEFFGIFVYIFLSFIECSASRNLTILDFIKLLNELTTLSPTRRYQPQNEKKARRP